jgi:voltage-gated potassium channel
MNTCSLRSTLLRRFLPGCSARLRGFTGLYQAVKFRFGSFFPLILGAGFLLGVFLFGLFIFMAVEGWNLLDSFYQVVMTLSTVGYMELHPLSDRARLMVSFLILMGVGCFAYNVGAFTQVVVEGRLHDLWGKRKVQKIIDSLDNHYIICGYGRIGAVIAAEFRREELPVVVLEKDPDLLFELERDGHLFLAGDAHDRRTPPGGRGGTRQGPFRLRQPGRRERLHHPVLAPVQLPADHHRPRRPARVRGQAGTGRGQTAC